MEIIAEDRINKLKIKPCLRAENQIRKLGIKF
jgi:hypothetical protein